MGRFKLITRIAFDTIQVLGLLRICYTGKLLGSRGTCAWTAIYITLINKRPLFRIGWDPQLGCARLPEIFFCFGYGRGWRIPVPMISWRMAWRFKILMPLHHMQQRFLCWSDGRYYERN